MQANLVYGLVDPRTLLVRYVGKSSSGMRRPRNHLQRGRQEARARTYRGAWVRQLFALDLEPAIVVLECYATGVDAVAGEIWWIAFGRALGWPLTNLTTGGEGAPGARRSPETRAKLSARMRGDNNPAKRPDVRARISTSNVGRAKTRTADHNAKIGAAHRGKPKHTEESRSRLREIALARPPMSAEAREKCRLASLRRWGRA